VSDDQQEGQNQPQPEPTGERFVPELMGGGLLEAEHQARYRFSLQSVVGKRVLDAGCGVGWGSALVLEAGAAEVVGVDLSEDAIADARARAPGAEFAVGDLLELPFDADTFDVALCFEAIEHTGNTERTLDELARVLRPDGLLFVSSPNPAVYPSGNPFHQNEETPEHLLAAAQARFTNTILFHQYLQIASVLGPDGFDPWTEPFELVAQSVTPLVSEHDPYSLVVASNAELPKLVAHTMLASSDQLDNITTFSDTLEKERIAFHDRMSAEAERITTEWERVSAEWERMSTESKRVADRETELNQWIESMSHQAVESEQQRDTYGTRSLNAEQQRARIELELQDRGAEFERRVAEFEGRIAELQDRVQELETRNAALEGQLGDAHYWVQTVTRSRSWRATESLRRVARGLRRLKP
jgi:SAM-dependent methyltransferase